MKIIEKNQYRVATKLQHSIEDSKNQYPIYIVKNKEVWSRNSVQKSVEAAVGREHSTKREKKNEKITKNNTHGKS